MKEKYPISIQNAIRLEKWLIDNSKKDEDIYLKIEKSLNKFSYDEVKYLLEASLVSFTNLKKEFNTYDTYNDELSFIKSMQEKYQASEELIKKRVEYFKKIITYLDKHPEIDFSDVLIFNKLVKDNGQKNIINNEETLIQSLDDNSYWESLLLKDAEELEEVKKAKTKEERKEQLANKLEVLKSMIEYQGFTLDEIIMEANKKKKVKGGFTKRLNLERVYKKN